MPYTLDPKYRIGIDEMDAEHARWIQLIEQFRAATWGHLLDSASLSAARNALERLLDYTRSHFASEEKFMAAHGYPGLEHHQRKHRELEAQVAALLDEIRAHKTGTTPLKLNLFITIWLMEHIMTDDLGYARHILKQQAA